MLKNTIKFAFRIFSREKFFTTINIAGLSLGFASCILLIGYISFETSYESHLEGIDNIHRITTTRYVNDKVVYEGTKGPSGLGLVVPSKIPGISFATRAYREPCLMRTGDKKLADQVVYWVDKDFLKVFKGILIEGNPDTALDAPLKMVITVSKAKALFGDENPIGKQVKVNEGMPFVITGIIKDTPENTHLKYGYLASHITFVHYGWVNAQGEWHSNHYYTYVSMDKASNPKTVTTALNRLALTHVDPKKTGGKRLEFKTQPVKDIHLKSQYTDEPEINGNINQIYIIIGIGVAILIIVFINFVNLSTALSLKRAKNIGVRKTFGASKKQLLFQYLVEAFLLNVIALVTSIIVVIISRPLLENLFQITFNFGMLYEPVFWFWALLFFILSTLAVGLYPALVLSSFNPITAIKGKIIKGQSNNTLVKKVLLTSQFAASIFLTIGAFIVYQQISFMQNSDLGINTDQVLVMRGPTTLNAAWDDYEKVAIKVRKFNVFKQELIKTPSVKAVGACANIPGQHTQYIINGVVVEKTGENIQEKIEMLSVDEEFLPIYNAKFLAGENFKEDLEGQRMEIIINEKSRKTLGYKSPEEAIGQIIKEYDDRWKIIGVVEDFHVKSLSEPISPTFLRNRHPNEFGYYIAKLDTRDVSNTLKQMESKWQTMYPEDPFLTHFSDEYFNRQYKKHEQFGSIFNALTLLAIFITNLGLLAMVSLTTAGKLKEIGVRRVIGAGAKHIFMLISEDFVKLIGIATLIAIPISWYFLTDWLNSFSYRINLKATDMIVCALFIFSIAFLNIMYFVLKALKSNPTNILKED